MKDSTGQGPERSSMDQAIKKFGPPAKKDSFDMSQGIPEFRIGLMNVINKSDYTNKPLIIQELTWETGKDTLTTIWFKKEKEVWLQVDSLVYSKNEHF